MTDRPRPARVLVFMGVLGVALLYAVGAPQRALIVQAVAVGLATLFAWRPHRLLGRLVALLGPLLLVTAAAIGTPQLGVRRWLALGPLQIEVAALVIPPLVAMLITRPRPAWAISVLLAAIALAAQPAPVAASALAVAVAFAPGLRLRALLLVTCVAAAALAWWWDVPLPPVEHVEGVIGAALTVHPAWAAIGVGIVVAMVFAAPHPLLRVVLAIFAMAPLMGAWPVPFVGYGASIWIGAGLACGLSLDAASRAPRTDRTPDPRPSPAPGSPRG